MLAVLLLHYEKTIIHIFAKVDNKVELNVYLTSPCLFLLP